MSEYVAACILATVIGASVGVIGALLFVKSFLKKLMSEMEEGL